MSLFPVATITSFVNERGVRRTRASIIGAPTERGAPCATWPPVACDECKRLSAFVYRATRTLCLECAP